MNSLRPGLNKGRAAADAEAAASAADAFDTIANMLDRVQEFARLVLKEDLDGGLYHDEAANVVDAISDATGKARQAESKLLE